MPEDGILEVRFREFWERRKVGGGFDLGVEVRWDWDRGASRGTGAVEGDFRVGW